MTITWYGHSCFKVEDDGSSVVFDPYRPGSVPGLSLPPLRADYCVCSHGHDDHFYPEGVELTGAKPPIAAESFNTFHDDKNGAKRGKNTVTIIELGGVRVMHMGDIGHPLTKLRREEFGRVDVLMVPVGGFFTIDAAGALEMKEYFSPYVTIPMHYRGSGFGYSQIDGVERFADLCHDAVYQDSPVLDIDAIEHPCTVILKCPVKK